MFVLVLLDQKSLNKKGLLISWKKWALLIWHFIILTRYLEVNSKELR